MRYTEIIYLITKQLEQDEIGNFMSSGDNKQKCFAKKQSVKTSEFYNATVNGYKPSIEFVIKRKNYENQELLSWNDELYQIIRTIDPKNKFDIVLVCSKKIGVLNGKGYFGCK